MEESRTARKRARVPAPLAGIFSAATRPLIIALVFAAALNQLAVSVHGRSTRWDFSIYYLSSLALLGGHNPYTADFNVTASRLGMEAGDITHATDPPTFLLLIEPLALMPPWPAYLLWMSVNAACLAGAMMVLLGPSSTLSTRAKWAFAAFALLYYPVSFHFQYGQSKLVLLLLLALMIRAMETGRDRAAGICLAIAGLLRIFPLLLIGYLAVQRRWRVLGYTMGALAVGAAATVALLGARTCLDFARGISLLTDVEWLDRTVNVSLGAFISRLFWYRFGLNPVAEIARRVLSAGAQAAVLGLTIRATWRLRPGTDPHWCALSMWVALSMMLSPTAWIHYQVLLLILFASMARAAANSEASARVLWISICSYLASSLSAGVPRILFKGSSSDLSQIWLRLALEEWRFGSLMLAWQAAYLLTLECADRASRTVNAGRIRIVP